ncbi:MAG: tetratricopeptide repeat protein [Thermoplasmata archaeon]
MKDEDQNRLVTAINPERLERELERDREEIELERLIEKITREDSLTGAIPKRERRDIARKISRKYYELGNKLVEDAQYPEAVDIYTKSISILKKVVKRKAVDSYFNRAITLAMMGYPKMALDDLNAISRSSEPKADIFFVKGQIFESAGRYKLAERMYNRCLEIDPQFQRASYSLERLRASRR